MQLLTAFTENEEIYPFLTYVTNQEQQKEKRGRPNGLEVWSVQLDPDEPPWLALQSRLTLTPYSADRRPVNVQCPAHVGNNYLIIQWL